MLVRELSSLASYRPSVLVIGSGPAGLITALELARRDVDVALIESGFDGFDPDRQELATAEILAPERHAPMDWAVRRSLGGASPLWAGRCVPFDDIDFEQRAHVPLSGWPIGNSEIRPWYKIAASYLGCGDAGFLAESTAVPQRPTDECRADSLERWSGSSNLRRAHAKAIECLPNLRVYLGITATKVLLDPSTGFAAGVETIDVSGTELTVRSRAYVIACGGLENARLLLSTQAHSPGLLGGDAGVLGRFYMGHLSGSIAEIVAYDDAVEEDFAYRIDGSGFYVRRRITIIEEIQRRMGLLNIAAWPDNPPIADPRHRSSILSLAYLALNTPFVGPRLVPDAIRRIYVENGPRNLGRHLANILGGPPNTLATGLRLLNARCRSRPRLPGLFIRNRARRYALRYHAEQSPNRDSAVRLSHRLDKSGLRQLTVDLRYSPCDVRSVVESHRIIDRWLRKAGLGELSYRVPEHELASSVLEQARDGVHQIGTTRMCSDSRLGVVDSDCRIHGTPNLFVAGSSAFPTAGQANPTFLLAALSARLAAHLMDNLPKQPDYTATAVTAG